MKTYLLEICILFFCVFYIKAVAQDERAQLPLALRNAYFGVSVGSINYNFSIDQFQAPVGYRFHSVAVNHPAVRLVLYGYEFNKYLSAQLTYMRPVSWVFYYYDIKGEINTRSSVWMNIGGLTLRPQLPLNKKFSLNGEVGLGIVTRHGFNAEDGKTTIISGVSYPTLLLGGGINYHLSDNWSLMLSAAHSPTEISFNQPATTFIAAGFNYKLGTISHAKLEIAAKTGYIHPKQLFQIGYSSNLLGYGVNNSLEKAVLFWGGDAQVRQGVSINYMRNVFHTARVFSLDWGVSAGNWISNVKNEDFVALSIYPVFRFTFLHTDPLDVYFYYSVAGPSFISRKIIDGNNTGEHFTFQDTMGTGIFFGKQRNLNAEIKIGHYSNGNLFTNNAAVKIPLSFNLGYAF